MLDASLRAGLIELLSSSFNSDEISELGALVLRKFDLHSLTNRHNHITVPVRDAAQTLVEACEEKKKVSDLVQLLIESDGSSLMGRRVAVKELEIFLSNLARAGYVYDFDRRKLRESSRDLQELSNWGALREGREYEVTVASVDIVGSSSLVRGAGQRTMERVYYQFWAFLRDRLAHYDGRIWSWAGDGGVMAFSMKNDAVRAVQCALEVQATLPIFNARPEKPIAAPISVRIGMDRGPVRYMNDTGRIISETINFAAHLEKAATEPGAVSISDALSAELPGSLRAFFVDADVFEGRRIFTTRQRPDSWSRAEPVPVEAASAGGTPGDEVAHDLH
ncbi:MAG: adenylate/guanylate cyclase domain-containing protein [Bacteroidetes bacterium]|jgi:class 3 adenylate cyclase|nr:adenylate/guanylate cyclase domain-containing protein [Bacteroidota bacterium]